MEESLDRVMTFSTSSSDTVGMLEVCDVLVITSKVIINNCLGWLRTVPDDVRTALSSVRTLWIYLLAMLTLVGIMCWHQTLYHIRRKSLEAIEKTS